MFIGLQKLWKYELFKMYRVIWPHLNTVINIQRELKSCIFYFKYY